MKKILLILTVLFPSMFVLAQIEHTNAPPLDAETFAQRLMGNGIDIFNAQMMCPDSASGFFWNGSTTNLGMESGIILTTGKAEIAFHANTVGSAGIDNGGPGYAPLEEFPNAYNGTFNACVLEFDFIPYGNEITLNYIFGSEEYPEYVGSSFNDIFAILMEGLPEYPANMSTIEKNIAYIPTYPLTQYIICGINFLNFGSFSNLYQPNIIDPYLQYDGQTVRLPAHAEVTPCNTYHITFAISDVSDGIYDSGLFLEENSLESNIPQLQSVATDIDEHNRHLVENCSEGIATVSLSFAPLNEYRLPITKNIEENLDFQLVLGGTATLMEDFLLLEEELIFSGREDDSPLFPEKPVQELRIIPIADNIEEETEYITIGIYLPCSETYSSMDTLWLEDELKASIIENIDICEANEVPLWASGGNEYHWFPADYLDCTDCPNPTATITHDMTYFVNIEKSGCMEQKSVSIFIDENLNSAFLEEETTTCFDQNITLKASGGLSYEWQGIGGASTSNLSCTDCATPIFSPPTSIGDYVYSVRISSGGEDCEKTLTTTIHVEHTELNVSANPSSICKGQTAVLTASGNAESYVWQNSLGEIIANTSSIEVNPESDETYTVSTQGVFCALTETIQLEVCQLDAIIEASDEFICKGDSVTITAMGDGNHTWLDSDNNFLGTGNELIVSPIVNTVYQLVAMQNEFADTSSILIAVEPTMGIQVFPEHPVICETQESVLLEIVNPIEGVVYEWEESEDLEILGTTGIFALAYPSSDKTYKVHAISPAGCLLSQEVMVSVGGQELQITVDAPSVVCIDLENPFPFMIHAYGAEKYTWTPIGGGIIANSGSSQAIFIPNPANNEIIYTVTGTSTDGMCIGSAEFQIKVVDAPKVSVEVSGVCEGETIVLEAIIEGGGENFEYEWSPVTGLSNPNSRTTSVMIDQPMTYTLAVRNTDLGCETIETVEVAFGKVVALSPTFQQICEAGEMVSFSVDGGIDATYQWTDPNGNMLPNTTGDLETMDSVSGIYTVNVTTLQGCEEVINFEVMLRELPDVSASTDFVAVCKGDTVRLELSGALTYELTENNGLPFEAIYLSDNEVEIVTESDLELSIVGTDEFGCSGVFVTNIELLNEPTSVKDGGFICFGDSIELSAEGGEGATYMWTPTTSLNNPNIANPIANPNESIVYMVSIIDKNGCTSEHTATVIVSEEVVADLTANPNVICTEGANKPVVMKVAFHTNYSYTFYNENGDTIAQNHTGQTIVIPSSTTTYSVIVTNNSGCTATDEITIEVEDLQLELAENFIVCENEVLSLQTLPDLPNVSYEWTPSIGLNDSHTANPTITTTETRTYTLTTISTLGCMDTIQTTIEVAEDCVYPGDADDNGKVNMFDLFAIGQHFGKSGFARNSISNKWQGFGVYDWNGIQTNGKNIKYIDCNGDGEIGFKDTVALVYNFDLHQKSGGFTKGVLGDPELQFIPNFEVIGVGETLELEVWIGSNENPVNDLYAIAFETFFNTNLIDAGSISMDYTASDMGTVGVDLLAVDLVNESTGRINVSMAKIDPPGLSGRLYLLTIRMKTQDIINSENFSFNITDFGATNSNSNELLVNVDNTPTIEVNPEIVGIEALSTSIPYQLYPSFTQDGFYLNYTLQKKPSVQVTLFDFSGRQLGILCRQTESSLGSFQQYIDLKERNLAAGVYLIEVKVEGRTYREKIVLY
ncbi:MAG: choice-of-anchor L domain-containing protein [Chitinophagales bacterium]